MTTNIMQEITDMAEQIFEDAFNAKLFYQQLSYFEDIDYSEKVHFFREAPSEEEIKIFLTESALTAF